MSWRKLLVWGLSPCLLAVGAWAQESEPEPDAEPEGGEVSDVIVVTASRTEQRLQEVPVAMTVISAEQLDTLPADDYGDVLRNVPGLNVTQISARDVQINTRKASGSLSTDQLVLLDGRTVYLDFFGFVMWDLLPVDFREIAQIEVVRGPGSAVWGANALGGVINLITKSPWEAAGTNVKLGAGDLNTLFASVGHARGGEKIGFKVSGSYYEQDPYDRPTGFIPGTNTPYPPFRNEGTKQPKADVRVDYNQDDRTTWSFSGGFANTDGIVHTGIGPFDVDPATRVSYVKVSRLRQAFNFNFFVNLLDGDGTNLLTVGADGRPLGFGFESQTYNFDFSNSNVVGEKNVLTYGATVRRTDFDLTIAPGGKTREEYGAFLQDEILFSDKFRWLLGARVDDIDTIGTVVSPRTSLMFAPSPDHNIRISYNEAFRAPSVVENFLQVTIVNAVTLPVVGQFIFPTLAVGNPRLVEESLEAYEIGYVGTLAGGKATLSLAAYRNELTDGTDFFGAAAYTSQNPPPGWPLPPIFLDFPPLAGALPSLFTYRNIGEQINEGFEFALDVRPDFNWRFGINYSYQDRPDVTGINPNEINIPAENRLNLSLSYGNDRYFGDLNVNFVDDAFWTDVLDARFHGPTDSYTMTNLSFGVYLNGDQITLSVIGTNIFDETLQQHVFGDLIARKVSAQVQFRF